jgi:hypothetical protein
VLFIADRSSGAPAAGPAAASTAGNAAVPALVAAANPPIPKPPNSHHPRSACVQYRHRRKTFLTLGGRLAGHATGSIMNPRIAVTMGDPAAYRNCLRLLNDSGIAAHCTPSSSTPALRRVCSD